jgi:DICT domain-containing protein
MSDDDEFVTAVNVADVLVDESARSVGFDGSTYRPVLDNLDETMFTSYDVGQMVSASREIEDRAWRAGRGSLHAGFQTVTTLASQRETYERLGAREGLDVHAYAFPDRSPDEEFPFSLHLERTDELERAWFVAYDGGGVDESKCALVAEERDPRRFYGFWTYDADTVDYVVDHLTRTYALAETDGGPRGQSA